MSKIPEGAKCVWKGKVLSAWEWEQEQFDGSYKTFELVKRFDSVQGILIDGDVVVLPYEIQPRQATWNYGLRGGAKEDHEEPVDGMAREFLEETGMQGEISVFTTLSKGGYVIWDEYIYIIRHAKKIQEPMLEAGEQIEMKRLSFDEFVDVLIQPGFRNSTFANYIIRTYVLSGKIEELRKVLLGK